MKDHAEYYPEDLNMSYTTKHFNRQLKLKPTTGKFWCGFCDRFLVGENECCKWCGKRNLKNRHIRLKKDY